MRFSNEKTMIVPSHRSDLEHINDLAEEVARMIGYDNIAAESLALGIKVKSMEQSLEEKCKNLFISHGFFEVINMPFTAIGATAVRAMGCVGDMDFVKIYFIDDP